MKAFWPPGNKENLTKINVPTEIPIPFWKSTIIKQMKTSEIVFDAIHLSDSNHIPIYDRVSCWENEAIHLFHYNKEKRSSIYNIYGAFRIHDIKRTAVLSLSMAEKRCSSDEKLSEEKVK